MVKKLGNDCDSPKHHIVQRILGACDPFCVIKTTINVHGDCMYSDFVNLWGDLKGTFYARRMGRHVSEHHIVRNVICSFYSN